MDLIIYNLRSFYQIEGYVHSKKKKSGNNCRKSKKCIGCLHNSNRDTKKIEKKKIVTISLILKRVI